LVLILAISARAETKSGDITLPWNIKDAVQIKMGTQVQVTCRISASRFFTMHFINALIDLHNTTQTPMYYSLNIAFFDADHNLIGCIKQNSYGTPPDGLKPAEFVHGSSDMTAIPDDQINKIKSYQITWYEAADPADL
jgi:hypothetical protein